MRVLQQMPVRITLEYERKMSQFMRSLLHIIAG